ncbi:MAG TPA: aldo/keto reductase [Fimbriimonadaceae bacterium]|nr:aldo/keto reductase [Fimbriimonadaceae bacterium]
METRPLGNSDLNITRIGFGSWAAGGPGWAFSWGQQEDADSIDAIHAALDLGINWIDTAAVYGLGHSEEVVAKALASRTQKPYIFTKCSRVWNDAGEISSSLKADSLRREVEASLKRLSAETIDLYQIHWPNPDEDIEEAWRALAKFKEEGKVRFVGVSNFDVGQMKRAQAIAPVTSLQPPYSLVTRNVEKEILPFCLSEKIGVIVYSPMKAGLLSGKMTAERAANLDPEDWRRRNPDFQEPTLSRNLKLAGKLGEIGERHAENPGTVAVAWTLSNPAVTGAIVGFRNAAQVNEMKGMLTFRLAAAEFQEIDSFSAGLAEPSAV